MRLGGCAAVAVAFQAIYAAFSAGVPSPLLTLPLLLATVTGALVAARVLASVGAPELAAGRVESPAPARGAAAELPLLATLRRFSRWCQKGPVAATLLGCTVLILTLGEFARPRQQGQAASNGAAIPFSVPGQTGTGSALAPSAELTLASRIGSNTSVVAYRGRGRTSALLAVSVAGSRVTITPLTNGIPAVLSAPVTFTTGFHPSRVEVTPMPGLGADIAVALAVRGGRVVMEAHDLAHNGRLVGRFVSGSVGSSSGDVDLRLAMWSGGGPNLFVIDRGLPGGAMRIQVLSQASDYRRTVDKASLVSASGFPASEWSVDVGPVGGHLPDVMLVNRNLKTGRRSVEVHVLAAAANFSHSLIAMPSTIVEPPAGLQNVLGYLRGSPTWFSVDGARARAQAFVLRQAVSAG